MSVDFANSETLKNLMRAFAGESQARNRYTFAAAQCRAQGLHVLEAVFQFTAHQEKEHAEIFYRHMKPFAGGTVAIDGGYPVDLTEDPVVLLRRACHGEYQEHQEIYPAFAETARQEGFDPISWSRGSCSPAARGRAGCVSTAATSTRVPPLPAPARSADTTRDSFCGWRRPLSEVPAGCSKRPLACIFTQIFTFFSLLSAACCGEKGIFATFFQILFQVFGLFQIFIHFSVRKY